jgi:hypothetical protein
MARIWFGLDLLWQHGVENRHNSLVNIIVPGFVLAHVHAV